MTSEDRESSDWHQCHRCRRHSGARSSKTPVSADGEEPETAASSRSASPVEITEDDLAGELRSFCREPRDTSIFDCYAFADYRGDKGDSGGGVVLAVAIGSGPVRLVRGVSSRKSLSAALIRLLREATMSKSRVVFGQDHQYGLPLALTRELGLPNEWRESMRRLFVGTASRPRRHPRRCTRSQPPRRCSPAARPNRRLDGVRV